MTDSTTAFAERMLDSMNGAFDIAAGYLGVRLGYYRALHDHGPATAAELAARTDANERMTLEWLEQQAASEVLTAERGSDGWRFALPDAHASALLEPDHPEAMAGTYQQLVAALLQLPRLVEAFRTGEGVPYASYGDDQVDGQAESTRAVYERELPGWFAAVPDLHRRLTGGAARVLDVGCGAGWSSISIATAFPGTAVDGIDLDPASVAAARANAQSVNAENVGFDAIDAADLEGAGYAAATFFEMLHDLARPVEALAAARRALAADGVVLVADELTAEEFDPPTDARERRYYGWSILSCLPTSMVTPGSAATGTVIRPATVASYAEQAGFGSAEVLDVDSDKFRLYLLRQ